MLVLTQSCPSLAIHTMGWQCHCVTPTPWAGSVTVSHQHHGLAVSLCHTNTMGCQCHCVTPTPSVVSVSFTPTPWVVRVIVSHHHHGLLVSVSHQHHGLAVSQCHTNTTGCQRNLFTPRPVTPKIHWSEQARLVSLSQRFPYWYPHLSAWNIVCVFYQITPFLTFTFKRECYQWNKRRAVHNNIFPPSLNRQ